MNKLIKVLLIDDDEDDYFITKDLFSEFTLKMELEWEPTFNGGLEKIAQGVHDVFLVDYRLGGHTGLDLLKQMKQAGAQQPFIMLTGQEISGGTDREALKLGATDYLAKNRMDSYSLEKAIVYAIDREKAQEALHDSAQKTNALFTYSSDAIVFLDKDLKIREVNAAGVKLLGLAEEPDNVLLTSLLDSKEARDCLQNRLLNDKAVKSVELHIRNNIGEELIVLLSAEALTDSQGKITGYQAIIHDITARKKAEQAFLQAEKLSMTGRLARTIAHEVRNPLTNVLLSLEQLKDELQGNEDADFYLDIINKNCLRINDLITELLNSAKPTHIEPKEEMVNAVLLETIDLAIDRIRLLGIELHTAFEEDIPHFTVDKEKIKIALLNIIINAIEAMPESLKERRLTINSLKKGNAIQIIVADTGIGIPKDKIPQLFEAFYTGKKTGTGLGLTATQNIIQTHNGSIEVQSKENEGTTFIIQFPIA